MLSSKEPIQHDVNQKKTSIFDKFVEQRMIEETEDEGFFIVTQEYYRELKETL